MARKYGDMIEINNCMALGISEVADNIMAIYVKTTNDDIYPHSPYWLNNHRETFTEEEEIHMRTGNNPPTFINGHVIYVRPEDRPLLHLRRGHCICLNADEGMYWLRDYPGFTKNFTILNSDSLDIDPGDIVVHKGYHHIMRVVSRHFMYDKYLLYKPGKDNIGYSWAEEVKRDKIFKLTRRLWERHG